MKKHTKSLIYLIKEHIPYPCSGAEIGVWEGENSEELLRAFPELVLWMVDRWTPLSIAEAQHDGRMAAKTFEDFHNAYTTARQRTARYYERRMVLRMPSLEAFSIVGSHESSPYESRYTLDFVFIDACHDYTSVQCDLCWYALVRRGGLICGHDYNGRGDRSGAFGVKRAVDEFFESAKRLPVFVAPGNVWWTIK